MDMSLTDDGDLILGGLELPESDIDGDTTLTLGLELVKNPGVLEGTLSELSSLLLELLDGTLVNTTTLVDHVTSGGGLAGIDVADNDDVEVATLFFTVGSKSASDVLDKVRVCQSQSHTP
jgi:hypothetical protein